MSAQVFKMPPDVGLASNLLVTILYCEDRGDFYYVTYRPVKMMDNKNIQTDTGFSGACRIYKDRAKPQRLPVFMHPFGASEMAVSKRWPKQASRLTGSTSTAARASASPFED